MNVREGVRHYNQRSRTERPEQNINQVKESIKILF